MTGNGASSAHLMLSTQEGPAEHTQSFRKISTTI